MNKICLSCLLLLLMVQAHARVPHFLGIWEFDLTASTLPEGFNLQTEIRSYDLRDDGFLVNVVNRQMASGRTDFIQVVSKSDGVDYPQYQSAPLAQFQIDGTTTPFTYSETVLDDYAVNIVAKLNGQIINTGTRRISEDGSIMTIHVKAITGQGEEIPFQLIFTRWQTDP